MITKSELRKYYKAVRLEMENKEAKDMEISSLFLRSDFYKQCETIFAYVSSSIEVDTHFIINKALSQNKTVAVPLCNPTNCTMEFYKIQSFDDLEAGAYGIYEPKAYCEKAGFDKNSLCLVPGLSFDMSGYRLGFGKGYYDRFLALFSGKAIGLCYNECVCDKTLRENYDKSVSVLITETEIYNIK